MSSVGSAISGLVSVCAQQCIIDYATDHWPQSSCSDTSELACLCDSYSNTGYAFGEIAELCVAAQCPGATTSDMSHARAICNSVSGHVQPTHTTLVVSVISVRTTTSQDPSGATFQGPSSATITALSASTTDETSTLTASATGTLQSTATDAAKTSSVLSPTTTLAALTSTVATSSLAATQSGLASNSTVSSTQPASTNSKGQTLGIALGVFLGVGVALALLLCCFCWRRKKKENKKTDGEDKASSLEVKCAGPASSHHTIIHNVPPQQHRQMGSSRDAPQTTVHNNIRPDYTRQWATVPVAKPPKIFLRPPTTWTLSSKAANKSLPQPVELSPPSRYSSGTQHTIFEEDLPVGDPHLGTVSARSEPQRHPGISRRSHAAQLAVDTLHTARQVSVKRVKLAPLEVQLSPRVGNRSGGSTPVKTPATTGSLAAFIEKNYCREDNKSSRAPTWFQETPVPSLKSDNESTSTRISACTEFEDFDEAPRPVNRQNNSNPRRTDFFPPPPPPPPVPPIPTSSPFGHSMTKSQIYTPSVYTCDERGDPPAGWI